MTKVDFKEHWNKAYEREDLDRLGWYEDTPGPSLELIGKAALDYDARILNVGAGTTTLVDTLLTIGYKNVLATDISHVALGKLKSRLKDRGNEVQWIVDDLTQPEYLQQIAPVDLWHDRAVLHFFTEANDQDTYFNLLKKLVKREGYVILATYNFNGATMCSGLPVCRYDSDLLSDKLSSEFQLIESFDFTYTQPSGDTREYVYTLFRRN